MFEDKNSETVGCAVFRGDKMVGELGLIETQIYNMLINDFTRNYITFKSEKADLPITITLGLDDRTKIHYEKQTHTAKINVKLDGDFISLPDDYITEDDLKSFEDTVSTAVAERTKSFLEKTRDEFCSDIVGIGAAAKSTFLTNSDFESYGWQDRYGNISFDVTVDFKVRRTGLTSRTETK